jgi:hypothetical protein
MVSLWALAEMRKNNLYTERMFDYNVLIEQIECWGGGCDENCRQSN